MSETTSPAVLLRARIGAYRDARRKRRTIGSTISVWVEAFDEVTDALLPVEGTLAALYWLPAIADYDSPAQSVEPVQTAPGQWRIDVPAEMVGTYTVQASLLLDDVTAEAVEIQFDIDSLGGIAVTSTGEIPWAAVSAAGAAAGASAGIAAGRSAGAVSGAEAGAAAGASAGAASAAEIAVEAVAPAVEQVTTAAATVATQAGQVAGDRAAAEAAAQTAQGAAVPLAGAVTAVQGFDARLTPAEAKLAMVSGIRAPQVADYLFTYESDGAIFGGLRDQGRRYEVAGNRLSMLSDKSVVWQSAFGGPTLTMSDGGIETSAAAVAMSGLSLRAGSIPGAVLEIGWTGGNVSAFNVGKFGVLQLMGQPALDEVIGSAVGSFALSEVSAYNAEAVDYSSRVQRRYVGDLHQATTDYVLWINYGQSLSFGFEAWPHVTRSPVLDVLMMGPSTRPGGSVVTTWQATGGDPTFQPLKGATQTRSLPSSILSDAQVAALTDGDPDYGEDPMVAAMGELRVRWLAAGKTRNTWVAASVGVGGLSTLSLSEGASPEYFNRIRGAIAAFKAQVPAGKTFSIGGLVYNQGEQDYIDGTTAEAYAANLATLIASVRNLAGTEGQQNGVLPVFLVQTGNKWTVDNRDLGVGRGQILAANTIPGVFLVTGAAPVPDKGGHLTGNGSRWVGCQVGKGMARVLVDQAGCENARAIRWVVRDRTLLGVFHGVGKMRFGTPYDGRVPQALPAHAGVYAADGAGAVALSNPRWVADRVLALDMTRSVGTLKVWLGRKADTNGLTWIADSDLTQFLFPYYYAEGLGFVPADNIADLVGLYLDPSNFVLADVITATAA